MRVPQISGAIIFIIIAMLIYSVAITICVIVVIAVIIAVLSYVSSRVKDSQREHRLLSKEAAVYFLSSNINKKLCDAINLMIDKYGIKSLSKFDSINILSDIYNFSMDIESKKIIIELFNNGILNGCIAKRNNKAKVLRYAYTSIKKNSALHFNQDLVRDVILTYIFAVSEISYDDIMALSKYDPNNDCDSCIHFSSKSRLILLYIAGLTLIYGGLAIYVFYFRELWLFFIALIFGIVYFVYFVVFESVAEKEEQRYKEIFLAVIMPIFAGMILNIIVGFGFFCSKFRLMVSEYLFDQPCYEESPYGITFLLLIIDLLLICACVFFYMYDNGILKNGSLQKNKRLLIKSSSIAFLGYLILYSIPAADKIVETYKHNRRLDAFKKEVLEVVNSNERIRLYRVNTSPELSFKGIKLGMDFTYVDSLINHVDNDVYRLQIEFNYSNFYEVDVDGFKHEVENRKTHSNPDCYTDWKHFIQSSELADAFEKSIGYSYEASDIIGGLKDYFTEIDNKKIHVYVFENMDKVGAILIKQQSLYNNDMIDFSSMKDLYSMKYGEPERILNISVYPCPDIHTEQAIYWTFKNGTIYIDSEKILYIDSIFISQLIRQSFLYKEKQIRIQDNAIREQEKKRRDAEEKQRRIEQLKKIREEENHMNAINEI